MDIRGLCAKKPVVIERDGSIQDAATLMRQNHVGTVVVVDKRNGRQTPVGIVTDRDIVVEVIAKGVSLDQVTVADIMTRDLASVDVEADLEDLLESMSQKGVARVPVVDKKQNLVGVIAMEDVLATIVRDLHRISQVKNHQIQREKVSRP